MALDKNKLKQALVDNFTTIRESSLSAVDSANGMAQAIVDYAGDAEVAVGLLIPMIPAIPPAAPVPDISVLTGTLLGTTTATVGQSILSAAILSSFTAKDPVMGLITTGIVAYALTFTSFTNNNALATVVTTMSLPPIFNNIAWTDAGLSEEEIATEMASIIHQSFISAAHTGTVVSLLGTIPVLIAGTLQ